MMNIQHYSDNFAFMHDALRECGFFIRLSDNTVSRQFRGRTCRILAIALNELWATADTPDDFSEMLDIVASEIPYFDTRGRICRVQ